MRLAFSLAFALTMVAARRFLGGGNQRAKINMDAGHPLPPLINRKYETTRPLALGYESAVVTIVCSRQLFPALLSFILLSS